MFFAFCVSLAGMLALAATFYSVELAGKRLDARLRELRAVEPQPARAARTVAEVVSR
jgi:hypothetical protein